MVVKRRSVSKKRKTVSKRKTNSKRKPVKRSVSKRKTNSKRKVVKRSVSKRKTNSKRKVVKRSVSKRKIKRGGEESNLEKIKKITFVIPDGIFNDPSVPNLIYKFADEHNGLILYKPNKDYRSYLKSEFVKKTISINDGSNKWDVKICRSDEMSGPCSSGNKIGSTNSLISRKNGKNKNPNSQAIIEKLKGKITNSKDISVFKMESINGYNFYLVVEFTKVKHILVPQTYIKDIPYIVAKKVEAQN